MATHSKKPTWTDRIICIAIATVGCFIAALGCCTILYVYAFTAMISPHVVGWDRWTVVLREMLLTPSVIPVVFGVVAFGVGVAIVVISHKMELGVSSFTAFQAGQ